MSAVAVDFTSVEAPVEDWVVRRSREHAYVLVRAPELLDIYRNTPAKVLEALDDLRHDMLEGRNDSLLNALMHGNPHLLGHKLHVQKEMALKALAEHDAIAEFNGRAIESAAAERAESFA